MPGNGRRFRELLAAEPYLFTTGIYDAISAKIAQRCGLKVVYLSGYSASLSLLARADLGFPTMTEMTELAARIVSAIDIPLIADADEGYGNALILQRTVYEYERAGVAGIHIEDQRAPKRCGHLAGKYVIPLDEAVGKIRAAVRAKSDPDFFLIARTDARGAVGGSLEEAIRRGRAYADAGADMVWAEFGSPDRADPIAFAAAMRQTHPEVPLAFNYSSSFQWHRDPDPFTFRELAALNYRYIFITLGAIHAAMYQLWEFCQDLAANQEQAQWRLERLTKGHPTESHHLMGDFPKYQQLEAEFLPPALVAERYRASDGFGRWEGQPATAAPAGAAPAPERPAAPDAT